MSYVYEIPFFRQHANKALRGILGGWDLSGVTIYQRGAPFSVTVPVDIARIRVTSSRATLVGDPSLPAGERTPVLHEPQHRGALRQQRAAHRWVWGGDGGRAGRTLEFGARLTF